MKLHPEFDANSAASQRELKQALNKLEEERPTERFPELEYFGQMHGTYLFAQSKDGLFIIDQHAAQERIKYEYFREKLAKSVMIYKNYWYQSLLIIQIAMP